MRKALRGGAVLLVASVLACSAGDEVDGGADAGLESDSEMLRDAVADAAAEADPTPDADAVADAGRDADDVDPRRDADLFRPDADVDEGPHDAGAGCDLISGAGCEADEKCGLSSINTIIWEQGCIPLPAAMAASPGGLCTMTFDAGIGFRDNCPGGYICLLRPGATLRVCEKLCGPDDAMACGGAYPSGPSTDGICVYNIGAELGVPGLMSCTPAGNCSPTCQDCVPPITGETVGCYVATDGVHYGAICSFFDRTGLSGEGVTGQPCGAVNTCAPGYYCHSTRRCRPYCDPRVTFPGGDDTCPFALCESRSEGGVGSCTVPEGAPEEMFSSAAGVALCLE